MTCVWWYIKPLAHSLTAIYDKNSQKSDHLKSGHSLGKWALQSVGAEQTAVYYHKLFFFLLMFARYATVSFHAENTFATVSKISVDRQQWGYRD